MKILPQKHFFFIIFLLLCVAAAFAAEQTAIASLLKFAGCFKPDLDGIIETEFYLYYIYRL